MDGIQRNQVNFIQSLNGMQLQNLYMGYHQLHWQIIDLMPNSNELANLETLKAGSNQHLCMNILKALTQCKNISEIKVNYVIWTYDIIDILCQYEKVRSIVILSGELKLEHLNRIVEKFPYL